MVEPKARVVRWGFYFGTAEPQAKLGRPVRIAV